MGLDNNFAKVVLGIKVIKAKSVGVCNNATHLLVIANAIEL